jgi:hypothetical protein
LENNFTIKSTYVKNLLQKFSVLYLIFAKFSDGHTSGGKKHNFEIDTQRDICCKIKLITTAVCLIIVKKYCLSLILLHSIVLLLRRTSCSLSATQFQKKCCQINYSFIVDVSAVEFFTRRLALRLSRDFFHSCGGWVKTAAAGGWRGYGYKNLLPTNFHSFYLNKKYNKLTM